MLIKLTAPDGLPVKVDSAMITAMRPNNPPNDFHRKAKTVLTVAGEHQAVVETMDQVSALIAAATPKKPVPVKPVPRAVPKPAPCPPPAPKRGLCAWIKYLFTGR